VTGFGTIARVRAEEEALARAAEVLRATRPEEIVEAAEKIVARVRALDDELKALRAAGAKDQAAALAAQARSGVVVARVDGLDGGALRALALAVRDQPGVTIVVVAGSPAEGKVAMVGAVRPEAGRSAGEIIAEAARTVGGGAGQQADVATAGGKLPERIDEALAQVSAALGL